MRSNRLQLLTLAVVAAVSLAACGGSSSSTAVPPGSSNAGSGSGAGSIKPGLKIAVLPKAVNIPYFDAAYAGAKKACDEIKAACEQIGPTQATGAAQVQFINTVIQKRYDALVISAADANSVVPALKKAQSTGVAVVTYDADVADTSARTAMVKPTTPDQIGKAQVEWIATAIGSQGGEIAILSAAASAENQNAWIGFMKQELKKYPNMQARRHGLRQRRPDHVDRRWPRACCSSTRTSRASSRRPRSGSPRGRQSSTGRSTGQGPADRVSARRTR